MSTRRPSGAGVAATLLIIVLLSAAFMAVIVFSGDTDTANRVIAIGIFIPLATSSVVFASALYKALFADQIARKRWGRINEDLHNMGFRDALPHEVEETLGLPVNLMSLLRSRCSAAAASITSRSGRSVADRFAASTCGSGALPGSTFLQRRCGSMHRSRLP